jgi:hypothetical protein
MRSLLILSSAYCANGKLAERWTRKGHCMIQTMQKACAIKMGPISILAFSSLKRSVRVVKCGASTTRFHANGKRQAGLLAYSEPWMAMAGHGRPKRSRDELQTYRDLKLQFNPPLS